MSAWVVVPVWQCRIVILPLCLSLITNELKKFTTTFFTTLNLETCALQRKRVGSREPVDKELKYVSKLNSISLQESTSCFRTEAFRLQNF